MGVLSFKSLEVRLVVTVGLGLLFFSVIAGVFTYSYSYRTQLESAASLQQQLVQTIQAQAEVAAFAANTEIARGVLSGLLANPVILAARIASNDGFKVEGGDFAQANAAAGDTYPLFSPVNNMDPIGMLTVVKNHAQVESRAAQAAVFQTLLLLTLILMAVIIMAFVLRIMMVNPITRLAQTIATIRPGSSARLEIGGKHATDEIGLLSNSANALLDATSTAIEETNKANRSLALALAELTEKEEAKSKFFVAASHDLRQPIHAMGLFLDALKHEDNKEAQLKLIQSIETASDSLSELLESLLDISKLDAGAVKPHLDLVNVEEFFARLDNNFSSLALKQNLRFKLWFPQRSLALNTDWHLLNIILANLTDNALKNTQAGGVLVGLRKQGDGYKFQVWDTGRGMRPEHIHRIYDEFYQVDNLNRDRKKGLGLGLAIAKRISMLLGYTLTCRSWPGKGTVFELFLPVAAVFHEKVATNEEDAAREEVDIDSFRGKRIAVLEDDQLVARALGEWLSSYGLEVSIHASAESALDDGQVFVADYFIVDFQLAGKRTGAEFLDEMQRRSERPIRAVLVTGNTSGGFVEATENLRWPVLFKPADPLQILANLAGTGT